MPVYLHGLALSNYRGFGQTLQRMAPFKDFNFFIGANNSGKSTVLDFIAKHLPSRAKFERSGAVHSLDQHSGGTKGQIVAGIGVPLDVFASASVARVNEPFRPRVDDTIRRICQALATDGFVWLTSSIPYQQHGSLSLDQPTDISSIRQLLSDDREWQHLWHVLTGQTGGGIEQHWIPETLRFLREAQATDLPDVGLIPAIREVGPKGAEFSDFSGRGLIDRLAEIQSPDYDKRNEHQLFQDINAFLQTVTGNQDAQIEVPHNREHVLVHMDGKVLPLASLGTGIHEVIMLAAFCTISKGRIVCIEEPELHLHPLLQRKLVDYLQWHTTNQYFISTHSASFIDTPGAAIFHVRNDRQKTTVHESVLKSERYAICVDLGHRASDIVQSNAVIWVEGPSDRIYVRHWIAAMEPEFQEGVHFSIMFYGGRLLSHLTAEDEEVSEFIALRTLNRNVAVVMDSDKATARQKPNATKQRILHEFANGDGIAWITKGREIENYIQHEVIQSALMRLVGDAYVGATSVGQYEHALHFRKAARSRGEPSRRRTIVETNADKVKIARLVCEDQPDFGILDLRKRVSEIVELVRKANR